MIKDEWRITSHAIELEMERIAGLLQKSARYHSRNERPAPCPAPCQDQPAPPALYHPEHSRVESQEPARCLQNNFVSSQ